jgi:hypothetical protein
MTTNNYSPPISMHLRSPPLCSQPSNCSRVNYCSTFKISKSMSPYNNNRRHESYNVFFHENRYYRNHRNDEMANPFLMLLGFAAGCIALLSLGIIQIQV